MQRVLESARPELVAILERMLAPAQAHIGFEHGNDHGDHSQDNENGQNQPQAQRQA